MERTFFTLRYKSGENWEVGKPISEQDLHAQMKYHQNLLKNDKILLGGAFPNLDEGLNILKVKNYEDAKEIADNDPAVIDKIMKVEG